jgi:hypothetical protein
MEWRQTRSSSISATGETAAQNKINDFRSWNKTDVTILPYYKCVCHDSRDISVGGVPMPACIGVGSMWQTVDLRISEETVAQFGVNLANSTSVPMVINLRGHEIPKLIVNEREETRKACQDATPLPNNIRPVFPPLIPCRILNLFTSRQPPAKATRSTTVPVYYTPLET